MTATTGYPVDQSVDVALRDGSSVHLRPIRTEDRPAVQAFLESLSIDSLYLRCFGIPNLEWLSDWSVDVDYADRYGLVATTGSEGTVVGHGAYVKNGEHSAEVAFEVGEAIQGHGIATMMLVHLAGVASQHGITVFTASVMPGNRKMIGVFRDSGFPIDERIVSGATEIEFPTSLTEEIIAAFDRREQFSSSEAVKSFLAPQSVAVIGASRRDGTVGAELLRNLIGGGFTGEILPVNPHAETIQGLRSYASVRDLPGPAELAVIIVPAADVAGTVRECATAGVRAVLVISAGFAEVGGEGTARQHELLRICRESGMRLIGPNCLGVLNTDPAVNLDATFAGHRPPAGRVAFLSQSGGLGIALIEAASKLGLGLSSFVSVGNKADISGNDLLEYWEHDDATGVILLYLESFGNPRRFARVARRVSRSKPILAVKSGRSPAGARATSSHTGALISASDVSVDALFRQAGVIRADTISELLDTSALLSAQPLPRGKRVAIVTNGGGPGIVCADACQAVGLDVAELPQDVRERLAAFLPPNASVLNPIDMIATASSADYRRVIEELVASDACDAIVTLFVPPLVTTAVDVRLQIHAAARNAGKVTVASVFMDRDLDGAPEIDGVVVPQFEFPEDAVQSLAHAVCYSEWLRRAPGKTASLDTSRMVDAAVVIERGLDSGDGWLHPTDVAELFSCYDLPLVASRVARGTRAAVAAAAEFGGPVALKAIAPGLVHKSDAGGVQVGLEGAEAVRTAAREIRRAVTAAGHRLEAFVVQPVVPQGVELLLGVVHDESFGPLIACGAGGTSAELLGDVSVRITPLSDLDAAEMVRGLRTFPLLNGYRGQPACDVGAVEDLLLRFSAMVEAHPEIAELDANPVVVGPDGAVIVDARVRVRHPAPTPPLGSLRS